MPRIVRKPARQSPPVYAEVFLDEDIQTSSVTGADLPEEIVALICRAVPTSCEPTWEHVVALRSVRRARRHFLSLFSLVCKAWCGILRPLLFSDLNLTGSQDLARLRGIVTHSEQWHTMAARRALESVRITLLDNEAEPWIGHLHWLSMHFPAAQISCSVTRDEREQGLLPLAISRFSTFHMLPSLPRSYVRLSSLHLEGLRFRSVDELAKFISGFPSLEQFSSHRLEFEDPSPLTYTRRLQKMRLSGCHIQESDGLPPFTLTWLAFALLGLPSIARLDMQTWNAVVHALSELMPQGPATGLSTHSLLQTRGIMCFQITLTQDLISGIRTLPDATMRVSLDTSAAGLPAIDIAVDLHHSSLWRTFAWDTLQALVHAMDARTLSILVPDLPDWDDGVELLCSLLRGERLRWALDAGKLSFKRYSYREPYSPLTHLMSSADILDVAAQLALRGVSTTLDVRAHAEYLMYGNGVGLDRFLHQRAQAMAPKKTARVRRVAPDKREALEQKMKRQNERRA